MTVKDYIHPHTTFRVLCERQLLWLSRHIQIGMCRKMFLQKQNCHVQDNVLENLTCVDMLNSTKEKHCIWVSEFAICRAQLGPQNCLLVCILQ